MKNIINFSISDGLVPAIIQDSSTGDVSMLGYMNQEALAKTMQTGFVFFWSRSRNRLWMKGEESGNKLKVIDIMHDCDNDSLLIKVSLVGDAVCHTGKISCFFINTLYERIENRKQTMPQNSRVASLFRAGKDRIIQKVGEEAVEVVIAAKNDDKQRLKEEVADVWFHLLVLLSEFSLKPEEIEAVLQERMG